MIRNSFEGEKVQDEIENIREINLPVEAEEFLDGKELAVVQGPMNIIFGSGKIQEIEAGDFIVARRIQEVRGRELKLPLSANGEIYHNSQEAKEAIRRINQAERSGN